MPLNPAHLIRSIVTLGIAQLITWIGAAALAVLLPRYLGDANLGKLAFGLAFTTLLGLLPDLGTATFLTKEVARAPERALTLTTTTFGMRLVLGALAFAGAATVATFGDQDDLTRRILYVMSAGMLVVSLSSAAVATLQGLQRIRALAAFSLATKLGYAGIAVAVLVAGFGPLEVACAWVVSQALGLAVALLALAKHTSGSLRPVLDRATVRLLLAGGLPFFMWQSALMVYGQVDAVILSFLTQEAVVGWYAAAYRLVTIPVFLPTIVLTVLFPALSATASTPGAYNALVRRALHLVLVPSLPVVLGIMLLADRIIGFLGYPDSFQQSVFPMVLLAPHVLLVGLNMVLGTVLNTRDRQKSWALAAVGAAILNPLLNVPAIAYTQTAFGNGALGAAVVTTLTELFMLVSALYLMPRHVLSRAVARDVARCMAAGGCMSLVVWSARDLPLLAIVAAGGVVYAGACAALGVVTAAELHQVRIHLLHRSGTDLAPTYEPIS